MRLILIGVMVSILFLLQACAAWPRHGASARPAVNLGTARVPALPSTPSPFGLTEREPSHARAVAKPVGLELYLRSRNDATELAAKRAVVDTRSLRHAAPTGAEPPVASAHAVQASPQEQTQDSTRYAQREQQAPALQDFRGGDAVVITMSTLVAVLLIVLLVVLIVD